MSDDFYQKQYYAEQRRGDRYAELYGAIRTAVGMDKPAADIVELIRAEIARFEAERGQR